MDCRKLPSVDIVADFEKPLPLPSNEYDMVYASYVIEHVSWRNLKQFISEIFRILKPDGKAEIVTANLLEQAKVLVSKSKWELNDLCMIFGDLNYAENSHKSSMSPELAVKLFREAGFNKVEVQPLPQCATDMIIKAYKKADTMQPPPPFGRRYFEGEGYVGLYRDFPCHYRTAQLVLERKPESVLELGGARGYVSKLLENEGIEVLCMDISEHCYHTRAIENFNLHDLTKTPWGILEKQFDLCFSIAFLEHISEAKLNNVIEEMATVSKRGLHGITFEVKPDDIDKTHQTIHPKEWWVQKFKEVVPDYPVEIMDKEDMEHGTTLPEPDGLVKLNIGCFLDCFHYGWENYDVQNLSQWAMQNGYIFKQVDVQKNIPKPDNSVDLILASHFIEHLDKEEGLKFLNECFRVLKPEGLIRLAIPDARLLCKKYLKGEIMEYRHVNVGVEQAKDDTEALFHLLLAGHKTIHDHISLKHLLEEAGFTNILGLSPFKSQSETMRKQTIPAYPTLSAYLEAIKPKVKTETTPKVKVNSKLKIGLISSPFLKTPPDSYGGLEMIVADLAEVLAKKGHEVTVFAADGSKVKGCEIIECGAPALKVQVDWVEAERKAYEIYKNHLNHFDIIHAHTWLGFEYLAKTRNPKLKICHTHHGGINLEWWKRSPPPFKLNFIAISKWMSQVYKAHGFESKYVYNGINLEKYPFQKEKGDRLLFVGRIDTFKQPDVAIKVAQKLQMGLDLVGGTFVQDPAYLQKIREKSDGKQIRLYEDAPHQKKIELMQNAKCLLFPSAMGEPFGLVPLEAMATGTPVIALNDGAVEEVVQEGGIVCEVFNKTVIPNKGAVYQTKQDSVEAIVEAFWQLIQIKPEDCRRNAEKFSREIMAENYLNLYKQILDGSEW